MSDPFHRCKKLAQSLVTSRASRRRQSGLDPGYHLSISQLCQEAGGSRRPLLLGCCSDPVVSVNEPNRVPDLGYMSLFNHRKHPKGPPPAPPSQARDPTPQKAGRSHSDTGVQWDPLCLLPRRLDTSPGGLSAALRLGSGLRAAEISSGGRAQDPPPPGRQWGRNRAEGRATGHLAAVPGDGGWDTQRASQQRQDWSACPEHRARLSPSRPAAGIDEGPGRGLPRRNLVPDAPVRATPQPPSTATRAPGEPRPTPPSPYADRRFSRRGGVCEWTPRGPARCVPQDKTVPC